MATSRTRPGRGKARSPPEQEADAKSDQNDRDDRASQLDLLDALDQDGDERAQSRDANKDVEEGRNHMEW